MNEFKSNERQKCAALSSSHLNYINVQIKCINHLLIMQCPGNVHIEDGSPCLDSTAACHDGVCLTYDLQCKNVWGDGAYNGHESCYLYSNIHGNKIGNCGQLSNGTFIKCKKE